MKKFFTLFAVCLMLGSTAAKAQVSNVRLIDAIKKEKQMKARFEQSVDISFNVGQGKLTDIDNFRSSILKPKATITASWIGGHRFNNLFFLGGGVGLGYALANMEGAYYREEYVPVFRPGDSEGVVVVQDLFEENRNTLLVNVFAQSRFYFGKKKLQPFVALSLGCSINPLEDWHLFYEADAPVVFMINPEAGLNYRVKDHLSFYFNIGYMHAFTDGLQLKLGVTF